MAICTPRYFQARFYCYLFAGCLLVTIATLYNLPEYFYPARHSMVRHSEAFKIADATNRENGKDTLGNKYITNLDNQSINEVRGIVRKTMYPNSGNHNIRMSLHRYLAVHMMNITEKASRSSNTQATLQSLAADYLKKKGYTRRLPDVITIGVKKSGTTLLSWLLAHHPKIARAMDPEMHFFNKYFSNGLDWYKSRMSYASEDQLTFEKTPRYFVDPATPGLMKKHLPPNVKFIVCVREPVERAISDFGHLSEVQLRLHNNEIKVTEPRTPISEGRRFTSQVIDPRNGSVRADHPVIDTSLYAKHMKLWLAEFPLERFHMVNHAQLMGNTYNEMVRLEAFLNLTSYFNRTMFRKDARRGIPCMANSCMANNRRYSIPRASPSNETISTLHEFFEPHNEMFLELLNLSC